MRDLQIESETRWVQPDHGSFAQNIIILRAQCGSPLKTFTLSEFLPKPGRKFELIGWDGSFTMEERVLAEDAKEFQLDI